MSKQRISVVSIGIVTIIFSLGLGLLWDRLWGIFSGVCLVFTVAAFLFMVVVAALFPFYVVFCLGRKVLSLLRH
jgi:hypothetical protein